ncbi:fumarylacetoacetase [Sphaerimonospora thailandensis]|uniref:fumarylacetoacetase n=1 Tax=Sphaerimonospora thailandensis TaxID=795644 RepID=A0A8J3RAE3_9ACTN|nr:fumarylacetoacetase [Sphaerimonospora thailandensis]GIH71245.1 fumarylacetoacetase [Sphaerimonospora thailandensis]
MTWIDLRDDGWGLDNLPYGVFSTGGPDRRVGVAVGGHVLDLGAAARDLWPAMAGTFAEGTLDRFMARGRAVWDETRERVTGWLTDAAHERAVRPHLVDRDAVRLHLPFTVADYVDFYASEHHAANLGRMFRPGQEPLTPNWRHLPIGYHGRAGTVVVSGTPVVRPCGQRRTPDGDIVFGPSTRLDIEAELGFVVGAPSEPGMPVPMEDFADHVFGACLVNDWSARDIQSWEYVPLGPFLGKSFATSVSPWVVPLAALGRARVEPPVRDPRPLPYLDDAGMEDWGLDIRLEVRLNGHVVSRPPFAGMYWTAAQQLAHMTVNGASLRTGDLFASGTISGPRPDERGSLIELSWAGESPIELPDGSKRTFLEDGDEVVITATAPGRNGSAVSFGEVRGVIVPPRAG